jgi:hypothetical protein
VNQISSHFIGLSLLYPLLCIHTHFDFFKIRNTCIIIECKFSIMHNLHSQVKVNFCDRHLETAFTKKH